ncbi:MAG: ketose-bisphosphate aldolase [Clostridia bacterium]
MPLTNMRTLISAAQAKKQAVGAFSVSSIEMICGVLHAAEALQAPIILQVAQARLETTPLPILGKAMLAAAELACVPTAVHLDHGLTLDCIRQALDLGFTSVMYDGSSLSMEENIANTRKVCELAKPYGAAVEAEIGRVGKNEDGGDSPAVCCVPAEGIFFARETNVDALAVAIGNAHGIYVGTPSLRFDVLEQISQQCDTPLVLHGGTGISDEDFRHCIRLGVHKINIATANFIAAAQAAHAAAQTDYFDMSHQMTKAVERISDHHIRVFAGMN